MTGKQRTEHATSVTVADDEWNATASCGGCDWEAAGSADGVRALAANHEEGTDRDET